jgi:hypothetical protein
MGDPGSVERSRGAAALIGLALAVRIALLVAARESNDARYLHLVVAGGNENLYSVSSPINYGWPPLWAQVLAAVDLASRAMGIPFFHVLGVVYLGVDALTAWVLARSRGPTAAALFFANPVSILTSTVYQQFDDVALLFLVLAIVTFEHPGPARRGKTAALLSLSLLVKQIAWFHPLLFLRRRAGERSRAILAPISAYAAFALSFLPFWRAWPGIRLHVFGYASGPQEYGLARLPLSFGFRRAIFVAAALGTVWAVRRIELPRACTILFLVILLTIPGSWDYYWVWPIAVGALAGGGPGFLVYSIVVGLYMLGSPDGLGLQKSLTHLPDSWGPWWAAVFWLLWEVRSQRRLAALASSTPIAVPAESARA